MIRPVPFNAPADIWSAQTAFSMTRAGASPGAVIDYLQAYGCGLYAAQDLVVGAHATRCRRLWLALRTFLSTHEARDALRAGACEAVQHMGGRSAVLTHARCVARLDRASRTATQTAPLSAL